MSNDYTVDSSADVVRERTPQNTSSDKQEKQVKETSLSSTIEIRSNYLVNRLFSTPENSLFNYVKFHLVGSAIKSHCPDSPRLMDIGCGLQVAKGFLDVLLPDNRYFGVDYEAAFKPDAVVDLFDTDTLKRAMHPKTDAVMLLDVLEHLTEDVHELEHIMDNVAKCTPKNAIVVLTLPQMYRLDRLKLSHLHYPEHKIRRTQLEWLASLEKHFNIESVQGLGYLSVIPYLPMLSKRYTPENRLGRLFTHLRSNTFEKAWIKPVDLFLSNTFGKLPVLKRWSNDFIVVARAK